jgi:predicted site-specific integrase-resolvase
VLKLAEIDPDELYLPGDVAGLFHVDSKTVTRWIKAGKFRADEWVKTPGGHHRLRGAGILRYAPGRWPSASPES